MVIIKELKLFLVMARQVKVRLQVISEVWLRFRQVVLKGLGYRVTIPLLSHICNPLK
jgi:hypothetical protein